MNEDLGMPQVEGAEESFSLFRACKALHVAAIKNEAFPKPSGEHVVEFSINEAEVVE